MARAIDANELEMFPYAEVAGTEEQIADWIEQVGLSGDDTASRARNLCWKVIEGFINVVKTQPTLTPQNEWISVEDRLPEGHVQVLMWSAKWNIAEAGSYWKQNFWVHNEIGDGYIAEDITYWMTLPAPPERQEDI